MKSRKPISNKLETFYKEIENKIKKDKKIKLQTESEFKQNKTYEINSKHNVDIFSATVRGGKAYAAEQKNGELNKRIYFFQIFLKK